MGQLDSLSLVSSRVGQFDRSWQLLAMGNCVSLTGKAFPPECARRFTLYMENDVSRVKQRLVNIGNPFAMNHQQFTIVSGLSENYAMGCFTAFDTDCNGLIDSIETISTICLFSSMDLTAKLSFVYSVFDFGKRGGLALDEVVILLHSVCCGVAKLDKGIDTPTILEAETLGHHCYRRLFKTVDDELNLEEFMKLANDITPIKLLLSYVHGAAGLIAMREGQRWEDPQFDSIQTTLYGCESYLVQPEDSVFGENGNFSWKRALADGFVFVPDDCMISRVCPGYFPSPVVAHALNILSARPRVIQNNFLTTGQESAGRYTMRFFYNGEWAIISVDDRMVSSRATFCATCCTFDNQLLGFCHSYDNPAEIWPGLLEKGLAKCVGSYATLAKLSLLDILEMLTGGSAFTKVIDAPEKLYQKIHHEFTRGVVAMFHYLPETNYYQNLANDAIAKRKGIAANMLYTVLGIKKGFVKVRAPVGKRQHRYRAPPQDSQDPTDSSINEDGVFWMPYDDFLDLFNGLIGCEVFEPLQWYSQSRCGTMQCSGMITDPTWYKNDQYCMQVIEKEALFNISVYLADSNIGDHSRGTISFVVAKHDYGECVSDPATPLTALVEGAIQVVARLDKNKNSATADVRLQTGKYIIAVLGTEIGLLYKYSIVVRCSLEHALPQNFSLYGAHDIDWRDVDESRDQALLEGGSKILGIDRLVKLVETVPSHQIVSLSRADKVLTSHLRAILSYLFEK